MSRPAPNSVVRTVPKLNLDSSIYYSSYNPIDTSSSSSYHSTSITGGTGRPSSNDTTRSPATIVKVPIGVTVAGGVCLLVAAAMACLCWTIHRKRKAWPQNRRNTPKSSTRRLCDLRRHSQSPHKESIVSGRPRAQLVCQSYGPAAPSYNPTDTSPYMPDLQTDWNGMHKPLQDYMYRTELSPPQVPMGMAAEQHAHEIDSTSTVSPPPSSPANG